MTENNRSRVAEGFAQDGFFLDVKPGDIVDTGTGPPTTIAIATSMWVPKGTVHNGTLLRAKDDVRG